MTPRSVQPSEFELQILGVLWEQGPSTVRQVMQHLTDGKSRAYTSVLSVMQVMHKKGQIRPQRKRSGLAHVYEPKVTREQVVQPLLKGLVSRVFGGDPSLAVQHLLQTGDVEAEDLDSIRRFLDELESDKKTS